jgi:signal transduction histidine kinase
MLGRARRYGKAGGDAMDEGRYREVVELVRKTRHDANSPITAALGHVQLLLDEPAAQDAEVQESLKLVESELKRLIDILGRLKEVKHEAQSSP